MVTYFLNNVLTVKDLKEKGYEITDNRNDEKLFPIGIKKDGFDDWLAIDGFNAKIKDNIDDTKFYRLEGRGFIGGIDLMFEIAKDFDLKFMNDEEYEILFFREKHNESEEEMNKLFEKRCDAYMNGIKKALEDET